MMTARELLDHVVLMYPVSFTCVKAAAFNDTMLNTVLPAYRELLKSDPVPVTPVVEAYVDLTPDEETPLDPVTSQTYEQYPLNGDN